MTQNFKKRLNTLHSNSQKKKNLHDSERNLVWNPYSNFWPFMGCGETGRKTPYLSNFFNLSFFFCYFHAIRSLKMCISKIPIFEAKMIKFQERRCP